VVVISIHNILEIVCNLTYWVFYHFEFPFIDRYKNNDNPWPWKEDPVAWRALVKKTLVVMFINTNIIPVIIYVTMDKFGLVMAHTMSVENLPDPFTLAQTMFFFMLVEDFFFYLTHRMLHHPRIYPHIHKMHHTHNTTVGIAAMYSHPIEFIISNMFPTSMGPLILGPNVHILSIFAWYIIRFGESLDGHSGYDFSWSPYRLIPFSGSAQYHDFHHSVNIGNYGSFFCIWDTVFGTNKAFNDYLKETDSIEKGLHVENLQSKPKLNQREKDD